MFRPVLCKTPTKRTRSHTKGVLSSLLGFLVPLDRVSIAQLMLDLLEARLGLGQLILLGPFLLGRFCRFG